MGRIGFYWQMPEPLQLVAPAHSLSGSVPAAMLPQVPLAPLPFFTALHAWQRAVHVVLQHTPSTQKPLAHCAETEQAVPLACAATHTPLWQ